MQLTDLSGHKLPKLAGRFRPRAGVALLSAIVRNAWAIYAEEVRQVLADPAMCEALTAQLESLYPAADMDTLARYGYADTREHVTVRIWRPEGGIIGGGGWVKSVRVELTRPVRVASRGGDLSTPAPWYTEEGLGLKPEYRATLSAEEWAKHAADIQRQLRTCVAPEFVPAFNAFAEATESYSREYVAVTDWPAKVKSETGEFPTWGELADAFPVTGKYLRSLIADSVQ